MSQRQEDSAASATRTFARRLGVALDDELLDDVLRCSPEHPSLLAISDALRRVGIEHEALQVEPGDLDALETPHIVQLHDETFAVVTELDATHVAVTAQSGRVERVPRETYLARWSGVVLVPSGEAPVRNPPVPRRRRVDRRLVWPVIGAAWITAVAFNWQHAQALASLVALGALYVAGLVLSALLSAEELGYSTAARRLCEASARTSCQTVLSSPAAALGPLSMADVGIAMFSGSLLVLTVAPAVGGDLLLLGLLRWSSLAALPYTAFSIAYQGLVLRRWCPLCVLVQVVLWGQAAVLWGVPLSLVAVPAGAWGAVALFPFPGLLWLAAKWPIQHRNELRARWLRLERLARDPRVLRVALAEAERSVLPGVPLEVATGASRPSITVSMYADPTCLACAHHFLELRDVLRHAGEYVRVVIRLVGPHVSEERSLALLARVADEIGRDQDEQAYALVDRWFGGDLAAAELGVALATTDEGRTLFDAHLEMMKRGSPFPGYPRLFVDDRPWTGSHSLLAIGYLARERGARVDVASDAS